MDKTQFQTLIFHYTTGFDSPRTMGKAGNDLPLARSISNALGALPPRTQSSTTTQIFMSFAQFISHEINKIPVANGN